MKKLSLLFSALLLIFTSQSISQWQTYQTPVNEYFVDVDVVNPDTIWACGYNGIVVKTTNGGLSWSNISIATVFHCYHINALDGSNAWVSAGGTNQAAVFRTTDGGGNWSQQIILNDWIDGIKFFNNSTGIVLSGPSVNNDTAGFYITRNGGLNWSLMPNSPVTTLLVDDCLGALDTNFVWFMDNNKFYRLSGGLHNQWQIYSIDTLNPYLLVSYFEDANTGYVADGGVGTPGLVIFKTTNGGQNWSVFSRDASMGVFGLVFLPNTNLAFVSGGNQIRVSTNSGLNWQYRTTYTLADSMSLYFMDAYDSNSVWITCSKGRLLKYNFAYIGINPISTEIPEVFKLYQNYPNPFNPSTKVKFDLPNVGDVAFRVYDVLGKLVYELNEYKQPGTYEVPFDGTNLSSGVYYYTIESGDFTQSKKMILLK